MRPLEGVCPSGQRERAVNPSAQPTEVRILPPPSSSRATVVLRRQYRSCGRLDGRTDLTSGTAAGNGCRRPRAPRRRVGRRSLGRSRGDIRFRGSFPTNTSTPRSAARSATATCRSAARPCISRGSSSRCSPRRSGASSRSRRRITSSRSRTPSPPRSSRSRSTGSPARSGSRRRTRSSSRSTASSSRSSSSRPSPRPTRSPTRWPIGAVAVAVVSLNEPTSRRQICVHRPDAARDARPRRVLRAGARLPGRRRRTRSPRGLAPPPRRPQRARARLRTRRTVRLRLLPDRPARSGAAHELRQLVLRAVVPGRDRARRRDRAGRARGPDQLARPAGGRVRRLLRQPSRCSS